MHQAQTGSQCKRRFTFAATACPILCQVTPATNPSGKSSKQNRFYTQTEVVWDKSITQSTQDDGLGCWRIPNHFVMSIERLRLAKIHSLSDIQLTLQKTLCFD